MKLVNCLALRNLILLLVCLPALSHAASNANKGIEKFVVLDEQVQPLTLIPNSNNRYGIPQEKLQAQFYQAKLSDFPTSKGRLMYLNGAWQGLILHLGQIHVIRQVLDHPPASTRAITVSNHPALAPNQSLGTCATRAAPNNTTRTPQTSSQTSAHTITAAALTTRRSTIGDFGAFCESTVNDFCLIAELSVVFDGQFISTFGENHLDQAVALLENVELLFRDNLNIGFHQLNVHFGDDVFGSNIVSSSANIGDVLNEITNPRFTSPNPTDYDPNRQSLFHLVSGREYTLDGDPGVLGLAFVPDYQISNYPTDFDPVICTSGAVATSQLVRNFDDEANIDLSAIVVAHEIGHNFGFEHDGESIASDCNSSGFIMGASLGINNGFSSCSIDALQNNIQQVDNLETCFDFPVDFSIQSNNTGDTINQTDFIRSYTITASTRNSSDDTPTQVIGTVSQSDAEFTSVTLAGENCALQNNNTRYQCNISNPNALNTLDVSISAQALTFDVTHDVTPGTTPDGDIYFDVDASNNTLIDTIQLAAENQPPDTLSGISTPKSVTLNWQDRSTNETAFSVQRRQEGSDWITIANNLAANTESYQDKGLSFDTTYIYQIIGHFPSDLNLTSEEVAVRTRAEPNVKKRSKGDLGGFSLIVLLGFCCLRFALLRHASSHSGK